MKRIRDASLIPPLLIKVELTALAFLVMIKRKKLKRRGKKNIKGNLSPFRKTFLSLPLRKAYVLVSFMMPIHTITSEVGMDELISWVHKSKLANPFIFHDKVEVSHFS